MKSILNTVLPAMALLTLGGCASTSALTTTESDGVYYSSKDRTTYNAPAPATASTQNDAPESTASDAETNPDYSSSGSSQSSTQSGGSEYYDDDYSYAARIRRFHQPVYRSFGYGYNDFIYSDPFWYGGSSYSYYGGGYSPYGWGSGYYGSYYDPFYGPYYGSSAVIINIGFGRPYYNPWRYGYGYGYGGYGYGGGYGRGYYDSYRSGGGYGGNYGGGMQRNVTYGPRNTRSLEATTNNRSSADVSTGTTRRSRVSEGGVTNPVGGVPNMGGATGTNSSTGGRVRREASDNTIGGVAPDAGTGRVREGRVHESTGAETIQRRNAGYPDNQVGSSGQTATEQPRTIENGGRRWRVVDNGSNTGGQPTATPTYSEPRRSRVREVYSGEQNNGSQSAEQPTRRQRTYEAPASQPQQQQRTYEAPQRTYEAPQRTYEAPSRSSSSEPSRSSSSDGGGRSSGGRGRVE
jgi:hypothetical protein